MKLYILRHGEAANHGDRRYASDAERPLTPKGIKRTRQLTNALRQMDITFDVILSSPLVRAADGGNRGARLGTGKISAAHESPRAFGRVRGPGGTN